ncbi:MAG: class D sortase [Armatimonadota bacterium]|nr:class D sortase [Armatimonadota bacterium]
MRFSPIVAATLLATAAILNCAAGGSNSTLAAPIEAQASGHRLSDSPQEGVGAKGASTTAASQTPVAISSESVPTADFSMDEKGRGSSPQPGHADSSGTPPLRQSMSPVAPPPAPIVGHNGMESTFGSALPVPPAPAPVVENVVAPTVDYYSDEVPAGFVRTVKTVKTEQRDGHTVVTTSFARYHHRPRPLPLSFIEIPALGMRHQIVEGVSQYAMQYGPGHFPGMAMPGELGNCGLAAHSNVPGCDYFHYLHRLHPGNHIFIETSTGVYDYTVMDMHVVRPTYTLDLIPTTYRRLTLVTCTLPSATRRLIVVAVGAGTPIAEGTRRDGNPPVQMPYTGR